jgi:hypothetical protein
MSEAGSGRVTDACEAPRGDVAGLLRGTLRPHDGEVTELVASPL